MTESPAETAATLTVADASEDNSQRTSRKPTPSDYVDEWLHLDAPPQPWTEPVSSLSLRKGSCETQWTMIKKKFVTWQDGQKNLVKLTVQQDLGIARQIANSERLLTDLHADGIELITNVRRANDSREQSRCTANDTVQTRLAANMRAESEEADRKLAVISRRWLQLDGFKEPMGLHEGLRQQKQRCAELMAQKDALIAELEEAVAAANRRYQADQLTQTGDIAALVDRIDRQVEVMREAYRAHLEQLQHTVDAERQRFKHREADRWNALYARRDSAELQSMQEKRMQQATYDGQLALVERDHRELNRGTRVQLERETDALQVELQTCKAEVMLNSEKLTYNYAVLQHRTSENVVVKAQQKKRLTRLNEAVAGLRGRYDLAMQQGGVEVGRLTAEVTKLYANVMDLDAKSETFAAISDQKYRDVWAVHEAECEQLLVLFGKIDRHIGEEYLGLSIDRNAVVGRVNRVRPNSMCRTKPPRSAISGSIIGSASAATLSMDAQVVEQILQKIATQTEWLQDNTLLSNPGIFEMLDVNAANGERLVKIDHVFNALGLTSAEHVQAVMVHFVPHVFCETCKQKPGRELAPDSAEVSNQCDRHKYVLEESLVIPTLRAYIEQFYQTECARRTSKTAASSEMLPTTSTTTTRQIRPQDVADFWQSFVADVPSHKDRLWTALEGGMSKYLQVLKKREKLDGECEFLRRQNAELKHLLLRYLPTTGGKNE